MQNANKVELEREGGSFPLQDIYVGIVLSFSGRFPAILCLHQTKTIPQQQTTTRQDHTAISSLHLHHVLIRLHLNRHTRLANRIDLHSSAPVLHSSWQSWLSLEPH